MVCSAKSVGALAASLLVLLLGCSSPEFKDQGRAPEEAAAPLRSAELDGFRRGSEPGSWIGDGPGFTATISDGVISLELGGAACEQVALETVALGRGALSPTDRAASVVLRDDGALSVARDGTAELLRDTDQGLEQSFSFTHEPPGHGDFEVRVRVSGAAFTGRVGAEHRFQTAGSGSEVRYGAATWIDASGGRTQLEVAYVEPSELSIVVPSTLLAATTYPALLDPVISVVGAVDAPVPGYAHFEQLDPAIAFGGTNYLAVWVDHRWTENAAYSHGRVYGTRVDLAGQVLDTGGFEIFGPAQNSPPAVAFDGTNYLVVMVDDWMAVAKRVTPQGVVLDGGGGKYVAATHSAATDGAVAFGDDRYLVTFQGTNGRIHGQFLDTDANPLGPTFPISTDVATEDMPEVTYGDGQFLVAWRRNSATVRVARVDLSGQVLDPAGIDVFVFGTAPRHSLAFDGTNYLVVQRTDYTPVRARRVSLGGALLDAAPIDLSSSSVSRSVAGFDGTSFVVTWTEGSGIDGLDIYANRIGPAGNVLDGTGVLVHAAPGWQETPQITCGPPTCLVAWHDTRAGESEILAALVENLMTVGEEILVTKSANEQSASATTYRGDGTYLTVWEDKRAGTHWDLYGAVLDTNGNVVSPGSFPIVQASGNQRKPRVATGGEGSLVVWENRVGESSNVYATKVDLNGEIPNPSGVQVDPTGPASRPAVASDGENYLVVWHYFEGASDGQIRARRFASDGTPLDATPFVFTGSNLSSPTVTFGAGNYLVVWSSGYLHAARITPSGTLLDAAPWLSVGTGQYPSAVYDGTNYVVAARSPLGGNNFGMIAYRVSPSGTLLDPAGIQLHDATQQGYLTEEYRLGPEAVFDGVDTMVVWPPSLLPQKVITAAWLKPDGTKLPPNFVAVSGTKIVKNPAIAAQGDGKHSLLTYAYGDDTPGIKNHRLRTAIVTAKSPGDACSYSGECKPSYGCVDDVCCPGPCGGDCSACSVAAGAIADGVCTQLTGTPCEDGNLCTQGDACSAGSCAPGQSVGCIALSDCHLPGSCQPATGLCTNPAKPNGAPCADADACTQVDTCQGGTCTGSSPVVCAPADSCHAPAVCDPTDASCDYAALPDGTACSDGDACTLADSCTSGACTAGAPVVCPLPDQCHEPATCDPATGACDAVPKPDGATCDDTDPCTEQDACTAGACAGTPKVCPVPSACQADGVCDAAGTCLYAALPDGASCDDNDACTNADACEAGLCVPGAPERCLPLDECHEAGMCDPRAGCSNPELPDGTPCSRGVCLGGECVEEATGGGGAGGDSGGSGGENSSSGSGAGGAPPQASSGASAGDATTGAGEPGADGPEEPEDGCSCRTSGTTQRAPWSGALLVMAILRRRERRART